MSEEEKREKQMTRSEIEAFIEQRVSEHVKAAMYVLTRRFKTDEKAKDDPLPLSDGDDEI